MDVRSDIINACRRGERAAQKELYVQLLPYLRAVCRRYLYRESDTKDVLQEVFVSIFKSINKYDTNKGDFVKWAVRITINKSINHNRTVGRRREEEFAISNHDVPKEAEVYSILSNQEMLEILKKMPTDFYAVFNLFCIDGYEHEEIAEMLKINSALSRKRLSRARNWLKKYFGSNHNLITDFPPQNMS